MRGFNFSPKTRLKHCGIDKARQNQIQARRCAGHFGKGSLLKGVAPSY